MESKQFSITVLIPVYNEADALVRGIETISKFMVANHLDHELLLIESGSTDGTDVRCDELAQRLPSVRVVHEGARNGFGSALKLGYRLAEKDLVWLVTVDLFFPLEALFDALPLLEHNDYVLSYRSQDNRGRYRRFQSFVYNRLIRLVLGLRVRHVNSGFRVLKRQIVQSIALKSRGWFIDAELLYRLQHAGYRSATIPVPLIDRANGRSSVRTLTFVAVLKELREFLRTRGQDR
jgi:glycosyltransferase involved in cell wall biosynthesis